MSAPAQDGVPTGQWTTRALALPAAALVAVVAVLGFQFAFGGGDFVPAAQADPCAEPSLPKTTTDLDQVTQAIVVGGVQDAACDLGITREELLLALPDATARANLARREGTTDAELLAAVKRGMIETTARLDRAGQLPKASALVKDNAADLGLSGLAAQAAEALPPDMIDQFLPTGAVVTRAIEGLDLAALLNSAGGADAWEPAIRDAVRDAAIAEVREQILERVPDSLGSLFGG